MNAVYTVLSQQGFNTPYLWPSHYIHRSSDCYGVLDIPSGSPAIENELACE